MGVRGLTTFIAKNSQKYLRRHQLSDTYIVIDGNNLASHLYKWYCTSTNDCFGGDYDLYAKVVREFFRLLEDCNVIPLVIFDGGYEIKKFRTVFSRLRSKIKSANTLNSVTQQSVSLFPLFLREVFVDIIVELQLKCVRCDFEADYEMACLARNLNCPVLSYDSDFYVFDVLYVPFSTFEMSLYESGSSSTGYCVHCKLYKVENFMSAYGGINKTHLPLVATLLGNDYIGRGIFKNFYSHVKLPKRKHMRSDQQRRIASIIKWLQNETFDSAVVKILSRLKTRRRRFVAHQIKFITQGYMCRRSKYIRYLNIEDVEKTLSAGIDSMIDPIEVLNEIDSAESVDSSDDDSCSDSSESTNDLSDSSLAQSDIEEEEEDESIESKEDRSIKYVPDWFLDNFRTCKYPSSFMDILSKKIYFFTPQLEDYFSKCSHQISIHLLTVIHKILCSGKRDTLKYVIRTEKTTIKKQWTNVCEMKLPELNDIPKTNSEDYQNLLLNILNIKPETVTFLSSLPENCQLYILCIIYWVRNANPAVTFSHVYSVILCMLILNLVDPQIGFCRSNAKFINKFSKKLTNGILQSDNTVDTSEIPLISLINNVTYNDCLNSMKELVKYFQIEEKMTSNVKLFDVHVVHCFAQFQSCLLHIKYLNALLNHPYGNINISAFYNGTFLYNMCVNLMKRTNVDEYINGLLKNSGIFLKCFKELVNLLTHNLSDSVKTNIVKRRRKKKKKTKENNVDQNSDKCSEAESEDCMIDINNRFTLLKLIN